ncbi:phytanoyl-CoA dioxygenase family protein [Sphingomonas sp. Leaf20]|uniref:phytanoyl-CoA dioxygenase family protein n=1 Tax=Sphingomonas sp. Leaf20 TaxID=1735685 RepID=UPI000700F125|nr:phytanoyl-CoA dioxygenase family protein [Sphingomonas sp. Leaf20]KQM70595.1 phytanoyl-CoA dioxygenase [Sphingomonas sp. Leaf20]
MNVKAQPLEIDLRFEEDGAQIFAGALDNATCLSIEQAIADLPSDVPGVRIGFAPALRAMLAVEGPIGSIAASASGPNARAVRAVLFDKTAARNWALGWHQDRTIVVEQRAGVDGFGPWTVKAGLIQVEPPFAILERMVTIRVHLDPVDTTNAPLRIVPGSHRLGRLTEASIKHVVEDRGERECLANRGDVWLYATPIVHGSRAADPPRRRRVLQVDYAAVDLPSPLRWRGL